MAAYRRVTLNRGGCKSSVDSIVPFEPRHEKTNVLVSEVVPHEPGCAATEGG